MRVDGERAFLDCYDATLVRVHRYASRLTGGQRERTEQLVREAYLEVLRRARERTLTEVDTLALCALVRQRFVTTLRTTERDGGGRRLVTALPTLPSGPSAAASDTAAGHDLLSDRERAALTLRFVDGMSTSDVAAALGASVRATEALMTRARARGGEGGNATGWIDRLLPEHDPGGDLALRLRRDLSVGWGVRGAAPVVAPVARSSSRSQLAMVVAVSAAAVGLVFGAVKLADGARRVETVASAGPTVPAPTVTEPGRTTGRTTPPATAPDMTAPPATAPDVTAPDVTVPDVTVPVPDVTVPVVVGDPAIDLRAGTLFGLRPTRGGDAGRAVDVEGVVDAIDAAFGGATADTGWYRFPDRADTADCRAGLDWRVLQWGDVTLSFVRSASGTTHLARWAVGSDPDQADVNGLGATLPEADPLAIGWNDSDLYFGDLDDLAAAGLPVRFVDELGNPAMVTDPALATRGRTSTADGDPLGLRLYGEVVIGIDATATTFC